MWPIFDSAWNVFTKKEIMLKDKRFSRNIGYGYLDLQLIPFYKYYKR